MKNIHSLYMVLAVALLSGVACRKFLSVEPDLRTHIDKVSAVKELLGSAYPDINYYMFTEFASDNPHLKEDFTFVRAERAAMAPYRFEDVIGNGISADESDTYFNSCYAAIASANKCLEFIASLPAGEASAYNAYKGEALLCRAYAHFMLVTLFAKTYDPVTSSKDLGVPYVKTVEKEAFRKYKRATVQEVYQQIEKDITEGLPLIKDVAYDVPKYHFNRSAALAFAARFYLHKRDWPKVVNAATQAFGSIDALVDNLRPVATNYRNLTYNETEIQWTSSNERANLLISTSNSTYQRHRARQEVGLSTRMANYLFSFSSESPGVINSLFKANDSHYYPSFGGFFALDYYGRPSIYNQPKFREYFKVTNPVAQTGYAFSMQSLLTTDELFFNLVEAKILLKDTGEAVRLLKKLVGKWVRGGNTITFESRYAKSFYYNGHGRRVSAPNGPIDVLDPKQRYPEINPDGNTRMRGIKDPLAAGLDTTSRALLKALLDIKMAVFYGEGMRWFDLMRHHITIYHPTREGRLLTLAHGDPHRLFRIPSPAVESGGLVQNPR